jgi:hypothetical protein
MHLGAHVLLFGQGVRVLDSFFSHVPNSSSLHPISFALSSTLVSYISRPKGAIAIYNGIFILGVSKLD